MFIDPLYNALVEGQSMSNGEELLSFKIKTEKLSDE